MKILRRTSFGALLSPAGVHVVEYRRTPAAVTLLGYTHDPQPRSGAGEAVAALADALESAGARGRSVSLCVAGFGVCQQILTLPPAPREVLEPVVGREMRRFYPELALGAGEPVIGFAPLTGDDRAEPGPREVLAAALPRPLLDAVLDAFARRRLVLEHWTPLPRVLQRLYEAYAEDGTTAAALLSLPGLPVLGFFHRGVMRLYSEPLGRPEGAAADLDDAVDEHLARGRLFLRQQFRGASVDTLLLAAESREEPGLIGVADRQGVRVGGLGPLHRSPGSLAALAPSLDGARADALNLLPHEHLPPSGIERAARHLLVAAVALVCTASAYWVWSARRVAVEAEQRVEAARTLLEPGLTTFRSRRGVASGRREHAARVEVLTHLVASGRRLPEVLWPLAAAPPSLTLRKLDVRREARGWRVTVDGTASDPSSDGAADALDALVQQLSSQVPGERVDVQALEYAPAGADTLGSAGPVALGFRLEFFVPERGGEG